MASLLRPYRLLLIVGEQWADPSSLVVDDDGEFGALVTALSYGGVPFDVVRLDQQELGADDFLDRGETAYGAIVWLVGPSCCSDARLAVLRSAVTDHQIPLLAISDHLDHPVLNSLLGLRYRGAFDRRPLYVRGPDHFITRGLDLATLPRPVSHSRVRHPLVQARGAEVLLTCDGHPALTINEAGGTPTAWLGSGVGGRALSDHAGWERLLGRTVNWLVGYHLGPDHSRAEMLVMDGVGSCAGCFTPTGQYAVPDAGRFDRAVVQPLLQHQARLVCHVTGAVPQVESRSMRRVWETSFVDAFGNLQDFRSLREGLEHGVTAGVVEIQSAGWSRMLPNLAAWWDAPPEEAKSNVGWYREFYDEDARQAAPPAAQLQHLRRAVSACEDDFGITPVALTTGDGLDLARPGVMPELAQRCGFALLNNRWILDHDRIVRCHRGPLPTHWFTDRDVALDQDHLKRYLAALPAGLRFVGKREWVAHHRTRILRNRTHTGLWFRWDSPGCELFRSRPSEWVLTLSDEQRQKLASGPYAWITVNGETVPFNNRLEHQTLTLPAGMGAYLEFASTG